MVHLFNGKTSKKDLYMQLSNNSFNYHILHFNLEKFEQFLDRVDSGQFSDKKLRKLYRKSVGYLRTRDFLDPRFLHMCELAKRTLANLKEQTGDLRREYREVTLAGQAKINHLPWEVVKYIFTFSDEQSLLNLQLVCKHFQALAKDVYDEKFGMQNRIHTTLFQALPNPPSREYATPLLLDLSHRDLSQSEMFVPSENGQLPIVSLFPNIAHLDLRHIEKLPIGVSLKTILDQCVKLQSLCLEIREEFFKDDSLQSVIESIANIKDLRSLRLETLWNEEGVPNTMAESVRLILDSCQNLEKLEFGWAYNKGFLPKLFDQYQIDQVYPNIKSLSLRAWAVQSCDLARFLALFPNLVSVKLLGCNANGDEVLQVLKANENLRCVRVAGELDESFLEKFSDIDQLEELDIQASQFQFMSERGFQYLSKLTNLRKLTVQHFELSLQSMMMVLSKCVQLNNLRVLDCFCSEEDDVSISTSQVFPSMKKLRMIDSNSRTTTSYNIVKLLQHIVMKAENLEYLELDERCTYDSRVDSIFNEIFKQIGKLQGLKIVKIATEFIDYQSLFDALNNLTELKHLVLKDRAREDNGILQRASWGLEYLKALVISKGKFELPPSLESLELSGSAIPNEVLEGVIFSCKNLRELKLEAVPVSDKTFIQVVQLEKLRTLFLSTIKLKSESISFVLNNLKHLRELHLYISYAITLNLTLEEYLLRKLHIRLGGEGPDLVLFEKLLDLCPYLEEVRCFTYGLGYGLGHENKELLEQIKKKYPAIRFT